MSDQEALGWADDARRYRLDGRIATGGMGEVWRATDTVLGREVAVKLLKNEYADNASFRARFEVEARHAASLHHSNIAAVYDFGEAEAADGSGVRRPFLVMELVDGHPLSMLLRPGSPMDPDAVRELLSQAADGLGAAHAAGIVHRDVKPANLLVTPDRQVKITDFGIARAAEGIGLTQTGEVMGTPQYLSPEQAQGLTATPASDVYSLGVVAFECLAGHRPFTGDSPVAVALAHLREPVPPLPDSVPRDLATVVERAMSKDPDARFSDGRALAAALRDPATAATQVVAAPPATGQTQVLTGVAPAPTTSTPAAPEAARRKRRWVWPVLAVIAAVLIVVFLVLFLTRDDGGDPAQDKPTPTRSSSPPSTPKTPESTPPSTPAGPATVRIDEGDYIGRPLADVERELGALGLRVDKVRIDNPGDEIENDVEAVNPTGTVREGDTVTVTYWGPQPQPPPPSPTRTPSSTPPTPTPTTPTPTPTTSAPSSS